jgi:hypothetical protein
VTFADWVRDSREEVRENGWAGVREAAYEFYVGMYRQVGRRVNFGTPIYETDWDLLVVLDACRWDLLAEVADEYAFLDGEWTYSVGSSSAEWMRKNFAPEYADEAARTAHVTANPYSERLLSAEDFRLLDEVWRDRWDESVRTIPAAGVTERAIDAGRTTDADRLIAHYMQPHHPFVPDPMDDGLPRNEFGSTPWDSVWHRLRRGAVDRDRVWDAYRDNLRYVLDQVETLLENVDAERAVITADHGNLLGEFGLYAHPDYVPLPALKRVPWSVTTAEDRRTADPDIDGDRVTETDASNPDADATTDAAADDVSVADRLEHLGYKQ